MLVNLYDWHGGLPNVCWLHYSWQILAIDWSNLIIIVNSIVEITVSDTVYPFKMLIAIHSNFVKTPNNLLLHVSLIIYLLDAQLKVMDYLDYVSKLRSGDLRLPQGLFIMLLEAAPTLTSNTMLVSLSLRSICSSSLSLLLSLFILNNFGNQPLIIAVTNSNHLTDFILKVGPA